MNKRNSLEITLGYSFRNNSLLEEALSHPSINHNLHKNEAKRPNYERLEFLGDSVLSLIISEMLFNKFTDLSEGKLAELRSRLVCRDMLAEIAEHIGLSEYIIMAPGEVQIGSRHNKNILENVIEAIIAAIYIDGSLQESKKFVTKFWTRYLDTLDIKQINPKSELQELAQSQFKTLPKYIIIEDTGPDHNKVFTVRAELGAYSAQASGNSKKEAEKQAAQNLLSLIYKGA